MALEQEAAATLREADAAKNALLLAAAHELKTPIAAVAGLAEILVRHPDLPEGDIAQIAEGLASTGAELRGILSNLLDSERVMGGYVSSATPVDLMALVVERARSRTGRSGQSPSPRERGRSSSTSGSRRASSTTWSATPCATPRRAPRCRWS